MGGFRNSYFTAPVSGIYRMSFTGQSAFGKNEVTRIGVWKNKKLMFRIVDGDGNEAEKGQGNNIASVFLMDLTQADQVHLWSRNYLVAKSTFPLIFTGELIHITN